MTIRRSISSVILTLVLALFVADARAADTLNVFHVRFDTATVKPGDTAIVNVLYTFDSGRSHNMTAFTAHFDYDTNEIKIDFITAGTASAMFWDTSGSRHGFLARSTTGQELDLKNPVLFRMRVFVSKSLHDTAYIRWDKSFPLFNDPGYGIDSEAKQDGWVRTSSSSGGVQLKVTGASLTGSYGDSIAFTSAVTTSSLTTRRLDSIQLQFVFDPRYLVYHGANQGSEATISSERKRPDFVHGFDTVFLVLASKTGKPLNGGDTLVSLDFSAIAYAGLNCTTLWGVAYKPLNADALFGSVSVTIDSVCTNGVFDDVKQTATDESAKAIRFYPNPASDELKFEFLDSPSGNPRRVTFTNALGQKVLEVSTASGSVTLPSALNPGAYTVGVEDEILKVRRNGRVIIAP